ncbi:MAG TPA: glycosyltransferase family 4 protein [Blastocatellia bacterium]|nr:glycosyltransferase family 4 protein [Blastocatellia bacterium]
MSKKNDCRALLINSGILGHKSVFNLLKESIARDASIQAVHINLSEGLTARERVIRRMLCFQIPGSARFSGSNIDLARWRHEFHSGLLAARRIRASETGFDVLHFHTQATAYCSINRMKSVPSIVSIDCTQGLAKLETASRFKQATYFPNSVHDGMVFRAAKAIIATSQWAAGGVAREYPDCADKLTVMPYPVRLESFDEQWIRERHKRATEVEADPVRVLFIGGDFIRKGGPELLAAWKEGDFQSSARLDLVTDWPIAESELPPGVRVLKNIAPFTPEWRDLWRRADLFVMPTRGEAFGMVYQESAAAGVPAVGSRINAVPEIIEDKITGLLVAPGDIAGLARSMRELIGSADLRRLMGTAARKKIESQCCPENYSNKLATLIKRLASAKND